ncbi:hypothetical protein AB0N81_02180 [Streptomyces sp. NPDC093510]|uniref:hypothetical protein n=1 Tax=Streptomyces sp. NPDC093510 TaxID=3155199 RepID=UPI003423709C
MAYLRSFLPWIAVAVLGGTIDLPAIALIGLVVAVAIMAMQRSQGRPWDAAVIEVSAVIYFAAVAALAAVQSDHSWLQDYYQPGSSLWLAVTAWGSLLIGKPFTAGIARTMVPAEHWNSPFFRKVNNVITAAWAAAFTATGVINTVIQHVNPDASTARTIVSVLGFVIPIRFTMRYPETARQRHLTK